MYEKYENDFKNVSKGYARRGLSEARLTEARARALVPQWGTNSIDYSTDNLLSKYYIYGSI